MTKSKKLFVTVGTTKFDKLIETVTSQEVLDILISLKFSKIQLQVGNGNCKKIENSNIELNYERYFEDLAEQIGNSDLVISHGGAGTCMEVLRLGKPLIVVINEKLMDNHQTELAEQLENDGYLYWCTPQMLEQTLRKDFNKLKPYPNANPKLFSNYLDQCMGFI